MVLRATKAKPKKKVAKFRKKVGGGIWPSNGPSPAGTDGPQKRRGRRVDKVQLAQLYSELYYKIPRPVTVAGLKKTFSDKELRVLMKHNGMLINDYDESSHSYSEKTKQAKCDILVEAAPSMIVPGEEPDGHGSDYDTGPKAHANGSSSSRSRSSKAKAGRASNQPGRRNSVTNRTKTGQQLRRSNFAVLPANKRHAPFAANGRAMHPGHRAHAAAATRAAVAFVTPSAESDGEEEEQFGQPYDGPPSYDATSMAEGVIGYIDGPSYAAGNSGDYGRAEYAQVLKGEIAHDQGYIAPSRGKPPRPSNARKQISPYPPASAGAVRTDGQVKMDPFANRPNLNRLALDLDEDETNGRTAAEVMYMNDQIGLLNDDGQPLEPLDEPSTDPEPWKVFAPRSFGSSGSLSGMINAAGSAVTGSFSMLRRLASPSAAQAQEKAANGGGWNDDPISAPTSEVTIPTPPPPPPPAESWWHRFSPTASQAPGQTAAAFAMPPPPPGPPPKSAKAHPSMYRNHATTSRQPSWWERFSPRASASGSWWGTGPSPTAAAAAASSGEGPVGGGGKFGWFGLSPRAAEAFEYLPTTK